MREPHANAGTIAMRLPSQIGGVTPFSASNAKEIGLIPPASGNSIGNPVRPAPLRLETSVIGKALRQNVGPVFACASAQPVSEFCARPEVASRKVDELSE